MTRYALTGTTGALGRLALEDLLGRVDAPDVTALVRDTEKARSVSALGVDVRHGDYDAPATLAPALEGVDVLLLVSSPSRAPGRAAEQHQAVIDAAVAAGVGRLVYTSGIGADSGDRTALPHAVTECALDAADLDVTVLRNPLYTDFFAHCALDEAHLTSARSNRGEITSASADQPLSTATVRDLAVAASHALTADGLAGTAYDLSGPLWTYGELAAALTRTLRMPVRHREVTDAETGLLATLFPKVRAGYFAATSGDLGRLLGHEPETIAELVERVVHEG